MILCGQSPRHLYVANKLCEAANVVAIVHESGGQLNLKKLRKLLNPVILWSKMWRWLRDRRRYTGNKEASFFFGDESPQLNRPDLVKPVLHINHPDVVKLADNLKPDLIVVFGTSLIRRPLLERGKYGIINLHGGLSPEYRGADCTFWALYNGEPEKIGCTLHYIDPGIDTGKLIAYICPEVKENDDELMLFWRAVRESASVYAEFIGRIENGEVIGQSQNGSGHLYQVKDRQLKHEKILDSKMKEGLLMGVSLPLRVKWFNS